MCSGQFHRDVYTTFADLPYLFLGNAIDLALSAGASPNDRCKYWGKKSWLLRLGGRIKILH